MTIADSDLPPGYANPKHIGQGGWAEVYRCTDRTGREVAVKLFHQRMPDPTGDADFRREFGTAAALSQHLGVIALFEGGITAAGQPWLALEHATGGTVAGLIEKNRRLTVAQAVDLTVSIADTMAWVHSLSSPVIHGDIKPANVLLDDAGRPRLSDFGAAGYLGSRRSVTVRQLAQTHAAPEVLRAGRASVASDIWSLAATLYEMLTGMAPFVPREDEGIIAFADRLQAGLPEDAIPATVPAPVAEVIRGGLTVDRDQRTASMSELAEALRSAQRALDLPVTPPWPAPSPGGLAEPRFIGYAEAMSATTHSPLKLDEPVRPAPPPPRSRRSVVLVSGVVGVVLLLTGAGIAFAFSGGDKPNGASGAPTSGLAATTPTATVTSPVVATTSTVRATPTAAKTAAPKPVPPAATTATYPPLTNLTIGTSASGTTVSFTVSVNPNGKSATVQVSTNLQNQTFATGTGVWSWSSSDNIGYSATDTISVTVSDPGRASLSKTVQQSTGPAPPPPPTVTVSKGTPCGGGGGAACAGGTCSSTHCAYIRVTTAHFSGNVSCTFNTQHGSGGLVQNVTWGANQTKDSPNWYGYPGEWVSATCGGVTDSFTWP